MNKKHVLRLGIAGATGFLMGLMLIGIAIAGLILAVMLKAIPGVHLLDGFKMVWIDMVGGQIDVSVREGILAPALAFGLANAMLVHFVSHRRKAV